MAIASSPGSSPLSIAAPSAIDGAPKPTKVDPLAQESEAERKVSEEIEALEAISVSHGLSRLWSILL